MTLGQGQWPRVIGKTGWNQCTLLLEKSVWGMKTIYWIWTHLALNVYVGMQHFHGNDIYYISIDDIPTKLPFTLLHKPFIFLMLTPPSFMWCNFLWDITCHLITCISNFLHMTMGNEWQTITNHNLTYCPLQKRYITSGAPMTPMLRLTFRIHAWLLTVGKIGRMNKMTKDNCRIGMDSKSAPILQVQ